MTNISGNLHKEGLTPPVVEPEEFDPVELLFKAQNRFNWSLEQFAISFGWEVSTIQKWKERQKFSRQARIRAATLKREWERDYGF
ncbi:hypothetical protein [Microcoleus sp. B3-D7]|uniref:hypothetical protein n=1 Tax=Microcoleus sp. B3-D7 TaxID=2818659 RepID=UPI002FCE8395